MTSTSSDWLSIAGFLRVIVSHLPLYLVWLAGFILAIVRWERHPRVSQLVVAAVVVSFINSLATSFLYVWLPGQILNRQGGTSEQIVLWFDLLGMWNHLVLAVTFGLILAATFGWRTPHRPRLPEDAEPERLADVPDTAIRERSPGPANRS